MVAKEFRNVLLFMCNRWCKGESNIIFNGSDFDPEKWKYSLGYHMWEKWLQACENHHGSLDCIASYILEGMDNENLQKVIDRTNELYNK
jgi:hypothetical protein